MQKAVIGLGFGDEGKGIVTDFLCSSFRHPLVIRFSGGQQAGHTVIRNGVRHTFSNFGSGTMGGAHTFWSKYCTIDPVGVMREYEDLVKKGFKPTMTVDPECPVTTPWDKRATKQPKYINNGTCGVGVGATWQREEDHFHLKYRDLFSEGVLKIKMEMIRRYYSGFLSVQVEIDEFLHACGFVSGVLTIKSVSDLRYSDIIFEGSQGLLLDQDIGFFPYVTRGNTGSKNIMKISNGMPHIYLVTRAYQTRHGEGPMTNTDGPVIDPGPEEHNKTNKYQGKFRTSMLDIGLLRYAIMSDEYIRDTVHKTLVITCLDHVENKWEYTNGNTIHTCKSEDEFVENIRELLGIESEVIRIRSPKTKDIKY